MKHVWKSYWQFALLAPALTLAVGCGGTTEEPTTMAQQSTGASADTTAAASEPEVVNGEGLECAQSVAVFLDSLRRGDETAANSVLTTKAREELAKTSYEIQPFGTPEGRYEIGRVGFPYNDDKSVALVECTWTEPATAGEPEINMDIVCQVHEEPEGWRISGIIAGVAGTDETLTLDFENGASLQATIDSALSEPATSQTAAAQPANTQGNVDPSLPSLPSFGSTPAQPVQQTATSPYGNNPLNR